MTCPLVALALVALPPRLRPCLRGARWRTNVQPPRGRPYSAGVGPASPSAAKLWDSARDLNVVAEGLVAAFAASPEPGAVRGPPHRPATAATPPARHRDTPEPALQRDGGDPMTCGPVCVDCVLTDDMCPGTGAPASVDWDMSPAASLHSFPPTDRSPAASLRSVPLAFPSFFRRADSASPHSTGDADASPGASPSKHAAFPAARASGAGNPAIPRPRDRPPRPGTSSPRTSRHSSCVRLHAALALDPDVDAEPWGAAADLVPTEHSPGPGPRRCTWAQGMGPLWPVSDAAVHEWAPSGDLDHSSGHDSRHYTWAHISSPPDSLGRMSFSSDASLCQCATAASSPATATHRTVPPLPLVPDPSCGPATSTGARDAEATDGVPEAPRLVRVLAAPNLGAGPAECAVTARPAPLQRSSSARSCLSETHWSVDVGDHSIADSSHTPAPRSPQRTLSDMPRGPRDTPDAADVCDAAGDADAPGAWAAGAGQGPLPGPGPTENEPRGWRPHRPPPRPGPPALYVGSGDGPALARLRRRGTRMGPVRRPRPQPRSRLAPLHLGTAGATALHRLRGTVRSRGRGCHQVPDARGTSWCRMAHVRRRRELPDRRVASDQPPQDPPKPRPRRGQCGGCLTTGGGPGCRGRLVRPPRVCGGASQSAGVLGVAASGPTGFGPTPGPTRIGATSTGRGLVGRRIAALGGLSLGSSLHRVHTRSQKRLRGPRGHSGNPPATASSPEYAGDCF